MVETNKVDAVLFDSDSPMNATEILIRNEQSIARARREAKVIVEGLGFSSVAAMEVLISVTELATNLYVHAKSGGRIDLKKIQIENALGIEVVSLDEGPGIENLELAMQDHYSTAGTMGCGLPAVKRLMDEFDLESQTSLGINCGTRIAVRKWLK